MGDERGGEGEGEGEYIFICQIKRQPNYVHQIPLDHSNTTQLLPSFRWFCLCLM
jgi:hypothetical protein